ncbi:MAG: RagB/SusD family nutrient uptake outer membrane protein, partial [Bacteroidales bacterium]|nr:RagB/SusD family nutrient uptake outer membrane protein [Bacteroidales bacterium]
YSFVQRGSYGLGLIYMMNAPADDIVSVSSSSDEGLEMFWCNYTESTRCIRDAWKVLYAGVARCNIILHYIDNVDMADDAKVQYKAEARFMRAFFYYHLAWLFGGVPLVTSYDSDGQEPRSPLEDVYGFILADLEYAWRNSAPEGVLQTSSAGKYTAAAYVARICNYLAACRRSGTGASLVAEQPLNDFSFVDADAMTEMALEACRDAVEHSQYVLIDDYANLFRETTKAQQYRECMLLAENPLSGSEGYWPNSFYLPTPANSGIDSPNVYG